VPSSAFLLSTKCSIAYIESLGRRRLDAAHMLHEHLLNEAVGLTVVDVVVALANLTDA
jgi:hypothetical protein